MTMESVMPDGKALQMGTSHFLGQNFSKPFEVKFADKENNEKFVWQTSWGVSWRLIGAMIMIHGDNGGLVLPPKVAPIQIVIVPIYYSNEDKEKVMKEAKKIKETLLDKSKIIKKYENRSDFSEIKKMYDLEKDLRIHIDDRDNLTPGFKFHDWELKGVPLRIEIGPKDIAKKQCVFAMRLTRSKMDYPIKDEFAEDARIRLHSIQKELYDHAEKLQKSNKHDISNYDQFKSQIEIGGFLKAPWCGKQECEEKIKEETGADIRVIPFGSEDSSKKCVYCNEQSISVPIFARGY